ncbi:MULTISPECIES: ribose-5-phosphate isomerase RpiA [Candidatus Ichthyocystis]|uniref:ribose-5-phosphate isomerase RpiA n=1 Tax=Candidatus Ichthyocystis TaxID=2929841 RepID=UPI000A9E75EE|nr:MULTISPECIES: ribose-5-phosphate isomerase RpiA [Ichthyocystis]
MNDKDYLKQQAATAVLEIIGKNCTIGVGTGSTVDFFIELLNKSGLEVSGVVPSSVRTRKNLEIANLPVTSPNSVSELDYYIDGADEVMENGFMLKGGGGALTGEKIVSQLARTFICIADYSKKVSFLGRGQSPVTLEVISIARSYVSREIVKMGGSPRWRETEKTDYGNDLIDVFDLPIDSATEWESKLSQIMGVVCCGIFAKNRAHIVILSYPDSVSIIHT